MKTTKPPTDTSPPPPPTLCDRLEAIQVAGQGFTILPGDEPFFRANVAADAVTVPVAAGQVVKFQGMTVGQNPRSNFERAVWSFLGDFGIEYTVCSDDLPDAGMPLANLFMLDSKGAPFTAGDVLMTRMDSRRLEVLAIEPQIIEGRGLLARVKDELWPPGNKREFRLDQTAISASHWVVEPKKVITQKADPRRMPTSNRLGALEAAALRIMGARDYYADHGRYPATETLRSVDAFDDWAADLLAVAMGFGVPRPSMYVPGGPHGPDVGHGAGCAMRTVSAAPCTCGKADAEIAAEEQTSANATPAWHEKGEIIADEPLTPPAAAIALMRGKKAGDQLLFTGPMAAEFLVADPAGAARVLAMGSDAGDAGDRAPWRPEGEPQTPFLEPGVPCFFVAMAQHEGNAGPGCGVPWTIWFVYQNGTLFGMFDG